MSIEGLLTIGGIVLAVYAIAHPVQRRSIFLLVPWWLVPCSLLLSAAVLFGRVGASTFGWQLPAWADLASTLVSFISPVIATLVAVRLWQNAKLRKGKDVRFRQFLLACLREARYDELVRIIEKNRARFGEACEPDTVDLLFEARFIKATIQARTWIHLELLSDSALLDLLPDSLHAAHRTLREFLLAEISPLRTSALIDEGGDETLHYTSEEENLINNTLRNPEWYHRCRAGYPLVITACERIDSGELDIPYNRADARYGTHQGIATRANCPVFLAIKTITHALGASVKHNSGTPEDTRGDAADLWDIFRAIIEKSVYHKETWDEPSGYGDYPTPYGFLLAEILNDYERICREAWRRCGYGKTTPPELLAPVVRMWAHCVMWLTKDEGHVSSRFRRSNVHSLLETTLERRQSEIHATDHQQAKAVWTQVFVESIKNAMDSWLPESRHYMADVLDNMDLAIDHIRENRQWFREELRIDMDEAN